MSGGDVLIVLVVLIIVLVVIGRVWEMGSFLAGEVRNALRAHQSTRREGIDAAFADRLQPPAATLGNELEALIEELRSPSAPGETPRRLAACREALALIDRSDQPKRWAALHLTLSDSLWWENPQGDRAQNVEEAISGYELALEVLSREDVPALWVTTQHKLFVAYWERIRGDRAQNQEEAISRCKLAFEVCTREDSPAMWATLQNNLAIAYKVRIRGDKAQNVEDAISRFELALEVCTREDAPVEWAETQNNLAEAYRNRIRGDRAENIEDAISRYELALEVYTREDFPVQWASTQNNLAIAYKVRIRGDRAENIEDAISRYELALEIRTREDFPVKWARTQDNLAITYSQRIRGDREQNQEEAISRCRLALEVRTREDFPVDWAGTQNNLATAYAERIRGDRAENIEEAISGYELALEVRTREDFPLEWARTQNSLAIAYSNRIGGDRAQNIEDAISRCERALEVYTRQDFPEDWAATQINLAAAYSDRIRGDRAQNLEDAIFRYEQALEVYTKEDFPLEWAMTQNILAIAYQDRIRGDKAQNLEEAISRCVQALEVCTRHALPVEWARTQDNLAAAYKDRIKGDKAQNLEEAISRYELALEVCTREDFPEDWARTQYNLANAYWARRIRGDRAQNQEEAISRYELALEVRTREALPVDWAQTQHNLATACQERIRGDREQNMEEAISRYELVLEVRTREALPVDWALSQNNLANAYAERIRGDRADNLEEAISRCKLALEIRTRKTLPVDWALTQHNLATVYWERIRGDKVNNMEEAISRYEQALKVYTKEDFPVDWARTQNNLANAYIDRIRGRRARNVEKAISCYEQALEVHTREDFPVEWAMAQNNLSEAYHQRIRGNRVENTEQAIHYLQQALEVRTPNTLPQDCRDTAYALGLHLYGEGCYAEAQRALTSAHDAVEALRAELQREGAKQRLAEENADLYARLVHCCLIGGDEEAAFEYAVAGKGRAFVDMLATSRFDLSAAAADDPQLGEDLRQARELRRQKDELLARLGGEGGTSPDEDGEQRSAVRSRMRNRLRSLQEQEAAHWEEMSFRYPTLTATQQAPTLSAEEAQKLSEELEATLVEYYHHAGGWCAFVVTPDSVGHVPLPGVDDDLLGRMTGWLGRIESPTGRGKLSYEPLRRLHEALIAPLRDYLPPGGRVVLAPFAHLHLLPLGAALDPITGRYVAEDHTLTFAPNLAALRTARQGASSAGGQDGEGLLSVAYPDVPDSDNYLPNVLPEAEAVARHFTRVTPLYEEAATPEAVLSHARGQDVLHLGCHGHFDAESPQQSGLMLSGGWLTVGRIITELHLEETRLATIGACRSGRVHVRQGEEHVGLVQAMMSAGAGAVVASLWPVDDAATRTLFEVFYAEAASGDSPAGALADAGALVRGLPGWEHPYYWAAFQVSGLAHGPYEPGLSNLSEEVVRRIEDAHRESMEKRGGLAMDETTIVRDSLVLLEQMGEEPEAVLEALGPGERQKVVAGLGELSGQAAGVRTEAELLGLADAIHRLVEETPALADLLLEEGSDLTNQRTVPRLDQDDTAHSESQYAMEHASQIRNRIVESKERLERGLQSGAEER